MSILKTKTRLRKMMLKMAMININLVSYSSKNQVLFYTGTKVLIDSLDVSDKSVSHPLTHINDISQVVSQICYQSHIRHPHHPYQAEAD